MGELSKFENTKKKFKFEMIIYIVAVLIICIVMNYYIRKNSNYVVINEVCCNNESIIYDRLGNYNDYIELYNANESSVDISGYFLSDDKYNLQKYTFQEGIVIEGGGYILLWAADGSNHEWTSWDSSYVGFSLKRGETLYLSDSEGRIVDKVKIPFDLKEDMSYSRKASGGWKVTEASPLAANQFGVKASSIISDEVVELSVQSGFYDSAFYLEMYAGKDLEIYYTVDGTQPSTSSLKYTQPIYIDDNSDSPNVYSAISNISLLDNVYIPDYCVDKATVVRAIAVDGEGRQSKEAVATYFVGYNNKYGYDDVSTISIITNPENLFDEEKGIYVNGKVYSLCESWASETLVYIMPANYNREGSGWTRNAVVQYFDSDGNSIYSQTVGIKIHGGWSTIYSQKGFNILALPEVDGNNYIFEGIFDKNVSSLMLRAGGFRDLYSTKIRDVLNEGLVNDRNIISLMSQPCQVFIDGEYWGLYNLQERISSSLIAAEYGVAEDNIVILKNNNVVDGDEDDIQLWNDLIEFATKNDLSIEANYNKIQQMMDVQSFIDYCSFEVYVANCDSIANNYSRWRTREIGDNEYEDGRWRWILYDTDDSADMVDDRTEACTDNFKEGNWTSTILDDSLFKALLNNEQFKKQFVVSFMDIANYNFNVDRVLDKIDDLAQNYCQSMVISQKRFFDESYTESNFWESIDVIKQFYEERYDYITAYLKDDFELEGPLTQITIQNSENPGGVIQLNTLTLEQGYDFSGKYYSDYECYIRAIPIEEYKFKYWIINGNIETQNEMVLDMNNDNEIVAVWEEING